jgi:hypothetical protein
MRTRLAYSSSAFSRSRSSLPLLKKGTCLARTSTGSPVRGLRPAPGVARAHRERAEAAQLDAAAVLERLDHPLQDHADHALDVALGQMGILLREFRDEFGLDH